MTGKYQLIAAEGRSVHVLEGEPLREGDRVDVQLDDGSWLSGTYAWSRQEARWPILRVGAASMDGAPHTIPLVLHPNCVLRRAGR